MKLNKFKQIIREEIQNALTNEAFLGMGNDDVVKDLLKLAKEGKLPKSSFGQFGDITFSINTNPATSVLCSIRLMDSKPTFKMTMFDRGTNVAGKTITATQSALKTLFIEFLKSATVNSGAEAKSEEIKKILGIELSEGTLKNLALGALTAASLAGSPKAMAAGGHKNKIEYSQNIPAERQKEVIKGFMEFLDANHTGPNNDPSQIEILIQMKEFDQVVNLFMVSEENAEVGTTQAESEILRKNFMKIYKRYLGDYSV